MITRLTQILGGRTRGENGWISHPIWHSFDQTSKKSWHFLELFTPRLARFFATPWCAPGEVFWRQQSAFRQPSEDFPMLLARAPPPPIGGTLKVAVSGVRAFIRSECGRGDVAVSLAPCSPSSISAALWHISLPTRSFRFAWQME